MTGAPGPVDEAQLAELGIEMRQEGREEDGAAEP
jgi:hypothetical protein